MSFQALLHNFTPFTVEKFVLPTSDGQECVLVIITASFDLHGENASSLSETQRPLMLVDQYYGDPARSSPRAESQLALFKPAVDVIVLGYAFAPRGRLVMEMQVGVRVGGWMKTIHVSGDRFWRRGALGASASSPRPFEYMPIVYERAFGGTAGEKSWRPNPVGIGYKGACSADSKADTEIPNLETPQNRIGSPTDTPPSMAFGSIGRSWVPRAGYAGTYDAAWKKRRWPLLPEDFDTRYNQMAPRDQQIARIEGGESIAIIGMHLGGDLRGALPRHKLRVQYVYAREKVLLEPKLDTVVFEPNDALVTLTWRASVITQRHRGSLREIIVDEEYHTVGRTLKAAEAFSRVPR
jgi:hypothetical protein